MSPVELTTAFFLQVAVLLAVCRAVGWAGERVGQPQVVGEMVAGFLIGPSFLGWIAPRMQAQLFPADTLPVLFVVSQLGLVLYMFCVGLEFRADLMRAHWRRAAAISAAGIVAPFALGGALGLWLLGAGAFFADGVRPVHAALFVGAAMSITAFPMLARIIQDHGAAQSTLGVLALSAGAMDDAAAWIILAVVLASFSGAPAGAIAAAGGGLLYVAAVVAARPLFGRMAASAERQGAVAPWMLAVTLAALAFGAWFTDRVGIYAVFGAFVLGAAVPRGFLADAVRGLLQPVAATLLVPLFFSYSGLQTRLGLVNSWWLWGVTAAVFGAACLGKGVACWAAARASGAPRGDALGIATLMNARGLMELILLNIGLQRGLITPALFTILALMAIGTTLMTGPLFGYIYRRDLATAPPRHLAYGRLR